MLVDLGRNDVGRVARYGTVQLSDVMTVERYSHVMHLCSNVTGRLQPGKTAFDALRACLPAGTLERGAQGAGHGDHRRTGAAPPRALRRRRRLHRFHAATWTPASPCGRWCSRARRPMSRREPASWPTACRRRTRGDAEQGDGAAAGPGDRGDAALAVSWGLLCLFACSRPRTLAPTLSRGERGVTFRRPRHRS